LLLVRYPKQDSSGGRNQRKRSAYEKGTPIQMEKLYYYFSWIVSLLNRDKSEMLLHTKQCGSKLLPQSDLLGWGGMLLEEIPRTTMYGRIAHNKR
jgi:hypothetical protein